MYKIHVKRAFVFLLIGLFVGIIASLVLPKVYLSETDVVVADPAAQRVEYAGLNDEVANILQTGSRQNARSEIAILASEAVFATALTNLAGQYGIPDDIDVDEEHRLYLMYDVEIPPSESAYDPVRFAAVKVKTNNPIQSAALANEIVRVYNAQRSDEAKVAVEKARNLLQGQVDLAYKQVVDQDALIRAYKDKSHIPDLNVQLTQQSTYLNQVLQQRDAATGQYNGAVASLAQLRSQLASIPTRSPDITQDRPSPMLDAMEQTVASLEARRTDLLEYFTQDSPLVRDNDQSIERAKAALKKARASAAQQYIRNFRQDPLRQDLLQRISVLEGEVKSDKEMVDKYTALENTVESQIGQIPSHEQVLAKMTRERDIADKDYQNLKAQQSDVNVRYAQPYDDAQVLSDAVPVLKPVAPEMRRYAAISAVLFACLGLVYSFLVESLKLPVYTSSQLTELTGVLVGASIPSLPKKMARQRAIAMGRAKFRPAESLRYMAVSALAERAESKVILVSAIGTTVLSSGVAGELAVAFAHAGARTILVDADLRTRPLEAAFGTSETTGVADLLSRSALGSGTESITIATEHPNLEFLPSGSSDFSQALADFPLAYVQALVQILRAKSDVVIINCPPCNVVADAARLAPYVDEVSMVVSARSTSFRDIPTSQDLLLRAGAKSVNIVLTNASVSEEPFARASTFADSRA